MKITSNPEDPDFRRALRELGAPEWYPQDAPRHEIIGNSEQQEDGTWFTVLTCSKCSWEKHYRSGIDGGLETISEGDKWAFHFGGTDPKMFTITDIEVSQSEEDERLDVFRKYLDGE